MTSREITVVIPVFRNQATLVELAERLRATMPDCTLVFVDDASDDESATVLRQVERSDPSVRVIRHGVNRGREHSVLTGLAAVETDLAVVLDADLQDPPEAVPTLLDRLATPPWHAVFAGRANRYSGAGRTVSGTVFRRAMSYITVAPRDAGGFVAMDRTMRKVLLDLPRPKTVHVATMVGATGLPQTSIPVARAKAAESGFSSGRRLRLAAGALGHGAWTWRRAPAAVAARTQQARQLAYYDGESLAAKRRMRPADTPYVRRHAERVVEAAEITPGDRVLDVGCGMGKYTMALADLGCRVEGLDLSPVLLEQFAAADRRSIPKHVADLTDPPAELLGQFDVVTAFMALHHMPDLDQAFSAMFRLCRPGGRIAVLEPNAYCPLFYLQITLSPTMSWKGDRGVLSMRAGSLRDAAAAAGFQLVEVERVGALPPMVMNRPVGPLLERAIDRVDLVEPVRAFTVLRARRAA